MERDFDHENIDVLCHHCGETLTAFLSKMAEHNETITCPSCGKVHEDKPQSDSNSPSPSR